MVRAVGQDARAFEGGIGGLGKTKPTTGVVFWDSGWVPEQSSATGSVTAELDVEGQPILVSFVAPWPRLPTTSGLEVRDLLHSESAFVQVVPPAAAEKRGTTFLTQQDMLQLVQDNVLSPQGKFGAYGAPFDVKVKQFTDNSSGTTANDHVYYTCTVTFTTLTPGLRESERQLLVKAIPILPSRNKSSPSAWILWMVGTTRLRFATQQAVLQRVLDSFEAIPAPASRRSSLSS